MQTTGLNDATRVGMVAFMSVVYVRVRKSRRTSESRDKAPGSVSSDEFEGIYVRVPGLSQGASRFDRTHERLPGRHAGRGSAQQNPQQKQNSKSLALHADG